MQLLIDQPQLSIVLIGIVFLNILFTAWVFWRFRIYQKIQNELLKGEEGIGNLVELGLKHKRLLQSHNKNIRELGTILEELVERNRSNIQKIGVVRYNPFADTGSNMSFVIALLNARKNGIVINSLHGRDGTRIYAKSVENGESAHHLTDEEKQAISEAK